jgi:hypothetical protein
MYVSESKEAVIRTNTANHCLSHYLLLAAIFEENDYGAKKANICVLRRV